MTGRVRRRWRNWSQLSVRDRLRLAQALVLLPTVASANRLFGFNRVRRVLDATASPPRGDRQPLDGDEIAGVIRMIELAARRGVFRANCLHRSMVTWWMLRRRGLDTEIRFGVRPRPGERPDFHAWVEHDGAVLNDKPSISDDFFPFQGPLVGGSWS